MNNMGTLHDRLHGRLWHTTHPDRFSAILDCGCVRANPDLPNSERWKATRPEDYPFVRCLGGVSLFDFADFDAKKYAQQYFLSNWQAFVPYLEKWQGAVWIEINRSALEGSFVSADEIVRRWKEGDHYRHTIMPRIEAANIGDIPASAFESAFMTWAHGQEVRDIDVREFSPAKFEEITTEWKAWRERRRS